MWLHIRSSAHTNLTNTSQASLLTVKLLEELVKVHRNVSAIFHSFVSKKTSRKKQRRELKAKKKKKKKERMQKRQGKTTNVIGREENKIKKH